MTLVALKHIIYEIAIDRLFDHISTNFSMRLNGVNVVGTKFSSIVVKVGNIRRYYSNCTVFDSYDNIIRFEFEGEVLEVGPDISRRFMPMFSTSAIHIKDIETCRHA